MILVTGGTGLLGAHLLLYLSKIKSSIRATYRSKDSLEYTKKIFKLNENNLNLFKNIEWVKADILDIIVLKDVFQGVVEVYHVAGVVSFFKSDSHTMLKVNHQGTANMVNMSLENNIENFCYVSSIITLPDGTMVDEQSPKKDTPSLLSSYAVSKYMGEMEVWRASQEGLNVLIVNPGVILGEGPKENLIDDTVSTLRQFKPKYFLPGSIGYISVHDTAKAMIQLMGKPIVNEQFILVAENLSFRETHHIIAEYFNFRIPKKLCPKRVMIFLSRLEKLISFLPRYKRRLPIDMVKIFYTNTTYNNSKVKYMIDFKFTPIKIVLHQMFKKMH